MIDCLFGTGLKNELQGLSADLMQYINEHSTNTISVDIPSGMQADGMSYLTFIKAEHTISFQAAKRAFFAEHYANHIGELSIIDIGLTPDFDRIKTNHLHYVSFEEAARLYKVRQPASHKSHHGHSLIVAGAAGKEGAAILAAAACVRAGSGLTTAFIPPSALTPLLTQCPEAMTMVHEDDAKLPDLKNFSAIGMGPGIGTGKAATKLLKKLLKENKIAAVLDADALNIMSRQKPKAFRFPCILTPHPKEFDRLFGASSSLEERLKKARKGAADLHCTIVLKGFRTTIITPEGEVYYTITGNAGLAKGGTGDVLTGIITALLAQGYEPLQAALLGVYLHGKAANICAETMGLAYIAASDIIKKLGEVFKGLDHIYE